MFRALIYSHVFFVSHQSMSFVAIVCRLRLVVLVSCFIVPVVVIDILIGLCASSNARCVLDLVITRNIIIVDPPAGVS